MLNVHFYDSVDPALLKFVVIVPRCNGKWVFCKHRQRSTYECPGGHIEQGESAEAAARRELYEETGATEYRIEPLCVYSVPERGADGKDVEKFGKLYLADITGFEEIPADFEMERIDFFDELPENWTYPLVQPHLLKLAADKFAQNRGLPAHMESVQK